MSDWLTRRQQLAQRNAAALASLMTAPALLAMPYLSAQQASSAHLPLRAVDPLPSPTVPSAAVQLYRGARRLHTAARHARGLYRRARHALTGAPLRHTAHVALRRYNRDVRRRARDSRRSSAGVGAASYMKRLARRAVLRSFKPPRRVRPSSRVGAPSSVRMRPHTYCRVRQLQGCCCPVAC